MSGNVPAGKVPSFGGGLLSTNDGATKTARTLMAALKIVPFALFILMKHAGSSKALSTVLSAFRALLRTHWLLPVCEFAPTLSQTIDVSVKIVSFLTPFASYSVRVDRWDILHKEVLEVASAFCSSRGARQLKATMHKENIYTLNADGELETAPGKRPFEGRSLVYRPTVGKSQEFAYRGKTFTVERFPKVRDSEGFTTDNAHLVIRCRATSNQAIKDLLEDCRDRYNQTTENTTTIWIANEDSWNIGSKKPCRNLNSVSLEKNVKDQLVGELERFLSDEEFEWYRNAGIPYRRGMLFWGPPGTGKTSCSISLAGHFGLDIYFISFSDPELDGKRLRKLFDALPDKCIILMQDVDSAGIQRADDSKNQDALIAGIIAANIRDARRTAAGQHGEASSHSKRAMDKLVSTETSTSGVTLSDLLNVIDGVNAAEGRILIMTSNTPDSLDPALIRPGRCDSKYLFGPASCEVMRQMFRNIFSALPEFELDKFARDFADKMPDRELTPAEISSFLIPRRDEPLRTLSEADEFVRITRSNNEEGLNAQLAMVKGEGLQTSDEEGNKTTKHETDDDEAKEATVKDDGSHSDATSDNGNHADHKRDESEVGQTKQAGSREPWSRTWFGRSGLMG